MKTILFLLSLLALPYGLVSQDYKHSFGSNITYGGGDGVSPSAKYEIFITKKLTKRLAFKFTYFKGDRKIYFGQGVEDQFENSKWMAANSTAKDALAQYNNLDIFLLGVIIPINSTDKSALQLVTSVSWASSYEQQLIGAGSNIDDYEFGYYSNSSLGFGLDLEYHYQATPKLGLNIAAFAYGVGLGGPDQMGVKIGPQLFF